MIITLKKEAPKQEVDKLLKEIREYGSTGNLDSRSQL